MGSKSSSILPLQPDQSELQRSAGELRVCWGILLEAGQNVRMRKQYSFWPGEEGLDAWDVDKLIELGNSLPVEEVAVDSVAEVDTSYWFGDDFPPHTVRNIVEHVQLIQELDPSYPIILGPNGRVLDGMHRIARALLDGRQMIKAVRIEVLPPPDHRNCLPEQLPY